MPEGKPPNPTEKDKQQTLDSRAPEAERPRLTRRDFLIRGNAGAVAVGVMSGAGFASTLIPEPAEAPPAQSEPLDPVRSRRVTLNVDGEQHDVTVDVRESLWETMNYRLGLSNCNLGCDRAQCGACTILMDGLPVNGCAMLTARSGRGQEITTVAGIANGPGVAGLHPVQRAFWFDGGFQCGICTRGFVMAAYALLQKNPNPTTQEIKEGLAGNICRCGEYAKIIKAVHTAAAEMRGESITYAAPPPVLDEPQVAEVAGGRESRQFAFVTALDTIEQFDEMAVEFSQRPGILSVSGTERTITAVWDPTRLDEARVRQILEEIGYPVAP
jgi:aerobic-type carbon monoxide dehydrogenase small subunit (CoxS/CutS family)